MNDAVGRADILAASCHAGRVETTGEPRFGVRTTLFERRSRDRFAIIPNRARGMSADSQAVRALLNQVLAGGRRPRQPRCRPDHSAIGSAQRRSLCFVCR